ncbi:ATP-dependent helicase HrpB [Vibrio genomosp. F6]|nr:ATP-dependent helicase HrpB [Vibrio genomosp. F6]
MSQLPIEAVMPELLTGVQSHHQLILKAAPGAGKSTHFPLQLLKTGGLAGKIIMLEPRRLAARNIAQYLSKQLGETVGQSVGYRVRGESKVSSQTKLEIVTEGIMTRMIQSDPELSGVNLLIFDEFHERSIHADTALALSLEIQDALRDDLKIVVMSATLDQQALQSLLPEACYVESQGRSFPVEYRYSALGVNEYLVPAMAKRIEHLMTTEEGSLLAFLPGIGAIKQLEVSLTSLLPDVDICPLYGQLNFTQQQRAIAASENGRRKVVLATNIAETSLTIEGIRLVVDSGLERVAKFDLKTGITKLEQVKIAQSSAEQRAGRAGRLEEGICLRLYSETQLAQQPYVPEPEILHADLSSLVLELAQWGTVNVDELSWLDKPPVTALKQATTLLSSLNILGENAQLTTFGKRAHELGLDPRISSMLVHVSQHQSDMLHCAILVAALLEEPERNVANLQHSLHRFKQSNHSNMKVITQRVSVLARKLNVIFDVKKVDERQVGTILSLAFPDRIGQRRSAQSGRFILSNGHGGAMDESQSLADVDYLIAIDLMRSAQEASQIFLAAEVDIIALEAHFPFLFVSHEVVDWDEKRGRLMAEQRTTLGKLVVRRKEMSQPDQSKMSEALLNYVRRKGLECLNWDENSIALLKRIRCAIEWLPEQDWPAMDDESLLSDLELWLAPYMSAITSIKQLNKMSLVPALLARLGWPLNQSIDEWLPTHYQMPTGNRKVIRYQTGNEPIISVRIQEVFGEHDSPMIAQGRKKIVLELLSPAQRPLQVTQDLAGFWSGSYKEVQKEMKGRYPKHPWPDDPANHVATTKTKRQLNK